ncbi:D-alanyl-D-alanine carboxypeptidase/D-alanyl-D-alanine-endopeptidase [Deinococcus arcticus]|uniref:D-alanyl-D-alanine carboxypeptidase n=1 Tax=Deinococcus arcticus TaxID=2136176 RepID=A0A2T3W8X1_9DEIO|nr:D-alanyl-D-alanine carboxypeptidase [Deinococcus arcticus]PTA68350.1 D-alanyl-D-alanine carboxypeptidase [Deinococcus arcticus]
MRRLALLVLCLLSAGAQAPEAGDAVRLTREPGLSAPVRGVLLGLPPGVRAGVLVVDLRTRAVLEAQAPDTPFIPASTVKLITAGSVLDDRGGALGAWTTELTVPAGQVGRAQVSHLTLRGSGDPTLAVSGRYSLRALARQARVHGVRRVGRVQLDERPLDPQSWAGLPLGVPMTALRLWEWRRRPPASVSEARARLGAALVEELRRAGITVASAEIGRAAPYRPYVPPARTDEQGRPLPPDPFIPVTRRPEQGVASVRSASPARVLAAMLRPSDNLRAEELLSTLAHRPGGNGALGGALARERAWLRRLGVDLRGLRLADGSGLSRDNRLSARALVAVLRAQYDLPHPLPGRAGLPASLYRTRGNAFIEALPQAGTGENVPEHDGRGGTLARRLVGAELDVRAKTGTLPGVSALAGYVTGRSGHPLAFAILMNGPDSTPILTLRALQDDLVRELAAAH